MLYFEQKVHRSSGRMKEPEEKIQECALATTGQLKVHPPFNFCALVLPPLIDKIGKIHLLLVFHFNSFPYKYPIQNEFVITATRNKGEQERR